MRSIVTLGALLVLGSAAAPAAAQDTERLYQDACDAGDLIACNVFGLMLEVGDQVPRNPARAARLYAVACQGGEIVGCTNLALLYETGVGVARDRERARGLYEVACEASEMLACSSLAAMEPSSIAPSSLHTKTGRVGDVETGAPIDGAMIEVPELGIRVVSDASGRFVLGGLPRGTYSLRAEQVGYERLRGELEVPGARDVVVLMTGDDAVDLDAPGRILGRIRDEDGGSPLGDVEVAVVSPTGAHGLSDLRGRFTLEPVEPGLAEVRLTRIGYAPRTARVMVHPGRTVELEATMFTRPIELEAIEVSVRSAYLERNGFYDRVERSSGTHFTRSDLDRLDPIEVSDLIRRVPGISTMRFSTLEPDNLYAVGRRGVGSSTGPCVLPIYVDGLRSPDLNLNQIPPEQIEAIELYNGVTAPMQYGRSSCGVVLVWTVWGTGD